MSIDVKVVREGTLAIEFPYNEMLVQKARGIPSRRFDKKTKTWTFPATLKNIEYINKWFPDADWTIAALDYCEDAAERKEKREETQRAKRSDLDYSKLDHIPFKLPPYDHQKKALMLGRDRRDFAYLMDQGTGKTKVLLDDAAHNFRLSNIDGLIVIAPNSVKLNWVNPFGGEDEVSKHLAPDIPANKGCWISSGNAKWKKHWAAFLKDLGDNDKLQILSVNVEAIAVDRVYKMLVQFCIKRKIMVVVDESTRIKNRAAKRTKSAKKLRGMCVMARIMTGTPLIKSPLDAFGQFGFMDPDILGYDNYYSFRNRYAVMGGYQGYQVLYYQNIEEISDAIDKVSYRVLKEECLDLPPKTYVKRLIDMNVAQARAYVDMRDDMIIQLENYIDEKGELSAEIKLTCTLRLQQLTAGFLPILDDEGKVQRYEGLGKTNPKIEEAANIIEECQHKVIVWCKFRPEIESVVNLLNKRGVACVSFFGDTSQDDRIGAIQKFQDPDDDTKVFVGQVRTGGIGITLTAARTVIYLSNTFSTEDRVQSEDRAHRIGQERPVTYYDLICPSTVDVSVLQVLRSNKKMSDEIMRDGIKEWI